MPKYKVPAEKPYRVEAGKPKPHQPEVYLPMKPEWLPKLPIGKEVKITIIGKVKGTHLDDNGDRKRSEVEIAIEAVEYYSTSSKEAEALEDPPEED